MLKKTLFLAVLLLFVNLVRVQAENILYLNNSFKKALPGDYIAMAQNKTYTLLHIVQRDQNTMTVEEISIPIRKLGMSFNSWKGWVKKGAPQYSSWKIYKVDLQSGHLIKMGSSDDPAKAQSFLTTLLNLPLTQIPDKERRRVGPRQLLSSYDKRPFWQPRLIFEGKEVPNVTFNAWKADWPKDGSELSEKTVEIYLPKEEGLYPIYYPYWLQISGTISQAKIRIVDSGKGMFSPSSTQNK